jgi:hypothetical protein
VTLVSCHGSGSSQPANVKASAPAHTARASLTPKQRIGWPGQYILQSLSVGLLS